MTLREYIAEAEANSAGHEGLIHKGKNYGRWSGEQHDKGLKGKELAKAYTNRDHAQFNRDAKYREDEKDVTFDGKDSSSIRAGDNIGNAYANPKLNYNRFSDQRLNNDSGNRRDKTGSDYTGSKSHNRYDDNRLNNGAGEKKGTGSFFGDQKSSNRNDSSENLKNNVGSKPKKSAFDSNNNPFTKPTSHVGNDDYQHDKVTIGRGRKK